MLDNLLYFAHGKESGPWGTKIQALAEIARENGFNVESPDYSDLKSPDERVKRLLDIHPVAANKLVLVGSSMGSYVSAVASFNLKPDGLFLLAPAFYLSGYRNQQPTPHASIVHVVHGWNDDVVPVEHAIRFAQNFRTQLTLVDSDHRLNSKLDHISKLFALFLDQVLVSN